MVIGCAFVSSQLLPAFDSLIPRFAFGRETAALQILVGLFVRSHQTGAGAGFEFGAIHQPGFSVALDLLWTATWAHTSAEGWRLRQLVPLPAGSLVYHW